MAGKLAWVLNLSLLLASASAQIADYTTRIAASWGLKSTDLVGSVVVDPNNENHVYVGALILMHASTAGQTLDDFWTADMSQAKFVGGASTNKADYTSYSCHYSKWDLSGAVPSVIWHTMQTSSNGFTANQVYCTIVVDSDGTNVYTLVHEEQPMTQPSASWSSHPSGTYCSSVTEWRPMVGKYLAADGSFVWGTQLCDETQGLWDTGSVMRIGREAYLKIIAGDTYLFFVTWNMKKTGGNNKYESLIYGVKVSGSEFSKNDGAGHSFRFRSTAITTAAQTNSQTTLYSFLYDGADGFYTLFESTNTHVFPGNPDGVHSNYESFDFLKWVIPAAPTANTVDTDSTYARQQNYVMVDGAMLALGYYCGCDWDSLNSEVFCFCQEKIATAGSFMAYRSHTFKFDGATGDFTQLKYGLYPGNLEAVTSLTMTDASAYTSDAARRPNLATGAAYYGYWNPVVVDATGHFFTYQKLGGLGSSAGFPVLCYGSTEDGACDEYIYGFEGDTASFGGSNDHWEYNYGIMVALSADGTGGRIFTYGKACGSADKCTASENVWLYANQPTKSVGALTTGNSYDAAFRVVPFTYASAATAAPTAEPVNRPVQGKTIPYITDSATTYYHVAMDDANGDVYVTGKETLQSDVDGGHMNNVPDISSLDTSFNYVTKLNKDLEIQWTNYVDHGNSASTGDGGLAVHNGNVIYAFATNYEGGALVYPEAQVGHVVKPWQSSRDPLFVCFNVDGTLKWLFESWTETPFKDNVASGMQYKPKDLHVHGDTLWVAGKLTVTTNTNTAAGNLAWSRGCRGPDQVFAVRYDITATGLTYKAHAIYCTYSSMDAASNEFSIMYRYQSHVDVRGNLWIYGATTYGAPKNYYYVEQADGVTNFDSSPGPTSYRPYALRFDKDVDGQLTAAVDVTFYCPATNGVGSSYSCQVDSLVHEPVTDKIVMFVGHPNTGSGYPYVKYQFRMTMNYDGTGVKYHTNGNLYNAYTNFETDCSSQNDGASSGSHSNRAFAHGDGRVTAIHTICSTHSAQTTFSSTGSVLGQSYEPFFKTSGQHMAAFSHTQSAFVMKNTYNALAIFNLAGDTTVDTSGLGLCNSDTQLYNQSSEVCETICSG